MIGGQKDIILQNMLVIRATISISKAFLTNKIKQFFYLPVSCKKPARAGYTNPSKFKALLWVLVSHKHAIKIYICISFVQCSITYMYKMRQSVPPISHPSLITASWHNLGSKINNFQYAMCVAIRA